MTKVNINSQHHWNNYQTCLNFSEFSEEVSKPPMTALAGFANPSVLPKSTTLAEVVLRSTAPSKHLPEPVPIDPLVNEQPASVPGVPLTEPYQPEQHDLTETCIRDNHGIKIMEINVSGFMYWKLFDGSPYDHRDSTSFLGKSGLHYLSLADAMLRCHFLEKARGADVGQSKGLLPN